MFFALAGAVSCTDSATALQHAVHLTVAPATDSMTLSYMCGKMFRIRNAAFEPRDVRWDIDNAVPADTGSLRLRGRDIGSTYVDYFVMARTNGTMRVFVGGPLADTTTNGNAAPCAVPTDRTPFPSHGHAPIEAHASAPMTQLDDTTSVRPSLLEIEFRSRATSVQRRNFQKRLMCSSSACMSQTTTIQRPGMSFGFRIPDRQRKCCGSCCAD